MKATRKLTTLFAAAALSATLAGPVSAAQDDQGFAMLKGVEAQALSAQEMQAIAGELSAADILAALNSIAAKVSNPQLLTAINNAVSYVNNHTALINSFLSRLPSGR